MLELSSARKNKVNLSDYNYQQDMENRMLIADFSSFDHSVLQEIFFSPLKLSTKKLARALECEEKDLFPILSTLSKMGLLSIEADSILVDKEMRKYFEFHMKRFDADFKPDMEFLQGILRKVPIHFLTSWYAIPRASNNIFESIVEKYLLTPQVFQRYLVDIPWNDPVIAKIIQDVFSSPECTLPAKDLMDKYKLSRSQFSEILLLMEFHFVCCLTYRKQGDTWVEFVSPFYEWQEYLRFFKQTEIPTIPTTQSIVLKRESPFAYVEDLSSLLLIMKKGPSPLSSLSKSFESATGIQNAANYVRDLVENLCRIYLAEKRDNSLYLTEGASDFLAMTMQNRALYLYRNPPTGTDKNIREAEKSVKRILHGNWVFFEDFVKGSIVSLNEGEDVCLKKIAKSWKYTLPVYSEEDVLFIETTVLGWLFETGMVSVGSCNGKKCFALTPFGKLFFEG